MSSYHPISLHAKHEATAGAPARKPAELRILSGNAGQGAGPGFPVVRSRAATSGVPPGTARRGSRQHVAHHPWLATEAGSEKNESSPQWRTEASGLLVGLGPIEESPPPAGVSGPSRSTPRRRFTRCEREEPPHQPRVIGPLVPASRSIRGWLRRPADEETVPLAAPLRCRRTGRHGGRGRHSTAGGRPGHDLPPLPGRAVRRLVRRPGAWTARDIPGRRRHHHLPAGLRHRLRPCADHVLDPLPDGRRAGDLAR